MFSFCHKSAVNAVAWKSSVLPKAQARSWHGLCRAVAPSPEAPTPGSPGQQLQEECPCPEE